MIREKKKVGFRKEGSIMNIPQNVGARVVVFAVLLAGLIVTDVGADITNGSFEIEGQPSLEGWEWTFALSHQDAPPNGGSWCVALSGGCVHDVGWQTDSHVEDGDVWRVSCWMRRDIDTPHGWGTLGWYVITQEGWKNGNVVECDSPDWTLLSVTDTFFLEEGDTVGVFIDGGGCFGGPGTAYIDLVETEIVTTGVEEATPNSPSGDSHVRVHCIQPNPFRESTCIQYELSRSSMVNIAVYSLLGREMVTLTYDERPAGRHTVPWNATNDSGRRVPSGTYFVKIDAGEYTTTRKLVVVR